MSDMLAYLIGVLLSCGVLLMCMLPCIVLNAEGDKEIMPTTNEVENNER